MLSDSRIRQELDNVLGGTDFNVGTRVSGKSATATSSPEDAARS